MIDCKKIHKISLFNITKTNNVIEMLIFAIQSSFKELSNKYIKL